ncbi:hypothetical protein AMK26_03740 [Streptomyces sp. CB03234]|uniref:hypothetical protein n=1 Tax=Streptomyces sp. (strain CB03234) TaxID=1703937 RepID=UPI00093E90AC|nr:hypothetical protein [Streptomyces sp. CB03234]OKK08148.1 hypothetical protein AMK26_03740 [Streptomyces sp. CB03234]
MRKAKLAAAAAGVVLLVAGCGGGGTDKGTGPTSGSPAPAGAGAEAEGGSLDAAAVTKEIGDAATAAGFTKKPSDDVPPALASCMVDWAVDGEKATDTKKSYDDTVAALAKNGWKESQSFDQKGSVIKSLAKSGWTLKASHHGQGGFVTVMFIATDNSPACEKAFREDLEKNKNTQ